MTPKKTPAKKAAGRKSVAPKAATVAQEAPPVAEPVAVEPPKMGRPSSYTPELAAELCGRLVDGNSLRTVCRAEDMPSTTTVFRWLAERADFRNQYARACEARADADHEEIRDIADDGTNDWIPLTDDDGENVGWKVNNEAIQRSKLRVDTRKWSMARMQPKRYGDRIQQEVTGPDGGPLQVESSTPEERMARIQELLAKHPDLRRP